MSDFWNLVEQAGPLRWPIFAVLAVGLALVIAKLHELVRDRSQSRGLFGFDLRHADLTSITRRLAAEPASMLAMLQSTMLNVFSTRPSEGMLHDEITNFVAFQQDQFDRFRRRMEFLSDTAGALGLMGTVWGMFSVFFQGTTDREVILRGMGIALITTLLGLVVSIVLNLSATELSTFFGRRLESVSRKADELRFRLLELAPAASGTPRAPVPTPVPRAASVSAPDPVSAGRDWLVLEVEEPELRVRAGDARPLRFRARRPDGTPASGVPIRVVTSPDGGGALNGGGREATLGAAADGTAAVDWQAPTRAGIGWVEASFPEQPGSSRRIDVIVTAAEPVRVEASGDNQAAVAGMRLPHPLAVRVTDRHDNPVPDVQVTFTVRQGGGRVGRAGTEERVRTGADGTASVPLALGSEAGPNAVTAAVEGVGAAEFTAFGTEV